MNSNNHATHKGQFSFLRENIELMGTIDLSHGDRSETGFHRLTKHTVIAFRFKSTNNGHYHSFRQVSRTAGKLNTIFRRFIDYTHIHTYTIYIISVRSVCQITCMFDK